MKFSTATNTCTTKLTNRHAILDSFFDLFTTVVVKIMWLGPYELLVSGKLVKAYDKAVVIGGIPTNIALTTGREYLTPTSDHLQECAML